VGKTWHKSKPDIEDKGHYKSAARHGHSHKYKYSHGVDLEPLKEKWRRPANLLEEDELDLNDLIK
jgi:hypothetical protein